MPNRDSEIINLAIRDSVVLPRIAQPNSVLDGNSAAYTQRGIFQEKGFFGDQLSSESNQNFNGAVSDTAGYFGQGVTLRDTPEREGIRNTTDNFFLFEAEREDINFHAREFNAYSNIPVDVATSFFYTLAAIDQVSGLVRIGQAVGLPELGNIKYLRDIRSILRIPNLIRVSFLAEAVYSQIFMHSRQMANILNSLDYAASIYNSALNTIMNVSPLGLIIAGNVMGSLLSRTLSGTVIPLSVAANNPNLLFPSYAGKAFFGERPACVVATDQAFPKRIGVFSDPRGSTGTQSFMYQNGGSFVNNISLTDAVSRTIFGAIGETSEYFAAAIQNTTINLANLLNVLPSSSIELRRSDNAMPFMIGMSCVVADDTHSPFDDRTFTDSWSLSSSVANEISSRNPLYLDSIRESTF